MKLLLLSPALFLSVVAAPSSDLILDEWNAYKAAHNKSYKTPEEAARRLETYLASKQLIDQHNSRYQRGETTFTMAINEFADWFPEEISRLNGLKRGRSGGRVFQRQPGAVVPEAINWVEKGAVTSVKNQGLCGSCYAFSAVGALEGLMFRTNHTITDLSAQEIVDCSRNSGCQGGLMSRSFKYVAHNHGIQAEESYPYKAQNESCHADNSEKVASCTAHTNIPVGDEVALEEAVGTVGPVSIGFAVASSFIHYDKGIYDGDCSPLLNHAMLAVGYDTDEESGQDYWLVKNSWGTEWGEEGYARVKRHVNLCEIADEAAYPTYD